MRYLHLPWTDNEVSCAQEQILVWTIWNQNCTCVMAVSSYTNPHFRGFFVCLCFLQAQHYRGLKRRREDVEQSVPKGATAWDSVLLTVQQSEGCICYWWNLFQVRSDFERMKKFRGVPPNGRFELKTNITQNWHHQNFFSVCPNHRHLFCRLVADVRTIIGSLWCLRKEKKRKRNGNVNKKKKKKRKRVFRKKKNFVRAARCLRSVCERLQLETKKPFLFDQNLEQHFRSHIGKEFNPLAVSATGLPPNVSTAGGQNGTILCLFRWTFRIGYLFLIEKKFNICFQATKKEVMTLFSKFGEVTDVKKLQGLTKYVWYFLPLCSGGLLHDWNLHCFIFVHVLQRTRCACGI